MAAILAAISLYGWWFSMSVGAAHGPGAELGIIAGIGALLSFLGALFSAKPKSN